jgi:hypothetical protein
VCAVLSVKLTSVSSFSGFPRPARPQRRQCVPCQAPALCSHASHFLGNNSDVLFLSLWCSFDTLLAGLHFPTPIPDSPHPASKEPFPRAFYLQPSICFPPQSPRSNSSAPAVRTVCFPPQNLRGPPKVIATVFRGCHFPTNLPFPLFRTAFCFGKVWRPFLPVAAADTIPPSFKVYLYSFAWGFRPSQRFAT